MSEERSEADSAPTGPVLVVLAHPDDPEFFCGGTIAMWADEGREITYCLLTRGDKGADEPGVSADELSKVREQEQRAAAQVLGVKKVIFLNYRDGELRPDDGLRRDVARVVRQVRPTTLVTSDPSNFYSSFINHADHRVAGEVALHAAWPAARSAMYFPELYAHEGLQPHKVPEVYIAGAASSDLIVDVTSRMDRKMSALREHKSQISEPDEMEKWLRRRMLDPHSPPESPRYIERFKRIQLR